MTWSRAKLSCERAVKTISEKIEGDGRRTVKEELRCRKARHRHFFAALSFFVRVYAVESFCVYANTCTEDLHTRQHLLHWLLHPHESTKLGILNLLNETLKHTTVTIAPWSTVNWSIAAWLQWAVGLPASLKNRSLWTWPDIRRRKQTFYFLPFDHGKINDKQDKAS